MKSTFLLIAVLIALCSADIYMHNPKGSNNRNRESSGNTDNDNRLFDSQNNNAGGYCWAPTPTYYEKSFLQVEWTNQHGCGSTHSKVDCDIVLQYMCDAEIRDGTTTDTIPFPEENPDADDPERLDENGEFVYGKHESMSYFRKCHRRRRNKGLFYADQNDPDSEQKSARFTRQGNDNERYGYECPEERDYYPYWHPTPWRDIVIFTSNPDRCQFFKDESQNMKDKWWCVSDEEDTAEAEYFETAEKCEGSNVGTWTQVSKWNIPKPECFEAGWNRDNHLGNGMGGFTNSYKWTLPSFDTIRDQAIEDTRDTAQEGDLIVPCVFRIRYNISSGDYKGGVENRGLNYENGGFADHTLNGDVSPVKQDPYLLYGKHPDNQNHFEWPLVLAINTNQFARTFEDRSHVFYIKPSGGLANIYNLVVRGKRGNIVQTYPAVEYDFLPNNLRINLWDYIHFQVTGCDTNPGGNDGEGRTQTDRSNMVQLLETDETGGRGNYPMEFEKTTMWGTPGTRQALLNTWRMAHLDQYDGKQCESQEETDCCYTLEQLQAKHGNNNNNKQQDIQNCAVLNAVGANGFDSGLIQMTQAGNFHYMSSRNNNFTNRSQKGTISVSGPVSVVTIVALVVGGGAATVAGVISAVVWSGNGSCLATVAV